MKLFVKRYSLDNVVQTSTTHYITFDVMAKGKRSRLLTILSIIISLIAIEPGFLAGPFLARRWPILANVGIFG
jgi:hypothetical protein